jgi:hypothetical protein
MSRPAIPYSEHVALRICEQLADGKTLKQICRAKGSPARSTVYAWLAEHPEFNTMFQTARNEHIDNEFDRLDDLVNQKPPTDAYGRVDQGWVANQKVKVAALQWKLSKLRPREFSDRMELTGAEGAPLMPPAEELSPERIAEAARRIAFILHRAALLQDSALPLLAGKKTG